MRRGGPGSSVRLLVIRRCTHPSQEPGTHLCIEGSGGCEDVVVTGGRDLNPALLVTGERLVQLPPSLDGDKLIAVAMDHQGRSLHAARPHLRADFRQPGFALDQANSINRAPQDAANWADVVRAVSGNDLVKRIETAHDHQGSPHLRGFARGPYGECPSHRDAPQCSRLWGQREHLSRVGKGPARESAFKLVGAKRSLGERTLSVAWQIGDQAAKAGCHESLGDREEILFAPCARVEQDHDASNCSVRRHRNPHLRELPS